jgi:DtxR family transcriptional regulator, manganese transport regulator
MEWVMSRDEFTVPTGLPEPKRQARSFEQVRLAHQREVAEDYVELIADLMDVTGEARAVDLAARLGVTHATVNTTINRLIREGLVRRERYRSIFLTDAGRVLAEEARDRHRAVRDFLIAIGVDRETAEIDAEGIEHHTSERTLAALQRFVSEQRAG